MELEDLITYSEQYEHRLVENLTNKDDDPIRGKINIQDRIISYNTDYSSKKELSETLCHEIMHHYFIEEIQYDMPESLVEDMGLKLYDNYCKSIERYVAKKLGLEDEEKR